MGVVSAAGNNLASSLRLMESGTRNAGSVSFFETPLSMPVYEVRNLVVPAGKMRTLQLAEIALTEALASAQLVDCSGLRIGVAMGTTVACQLNDIAFYSRLRASNVSRADGSHQVDPTDAVGQFLSSNLAEAMAKKLGAEGPQLTVVNACSSGADAIGAALSWLKAGLCDIAIAGGADELNRVPVCGFNALGVASDEPCAPFDANRKGLNLGEGAGILVLETEASAQQRGVVPSLELCGYGSSADAYHMTAPHPEGAGLERAICSALKQSNISAADIAFVNAHGTATRENDKVEGNTLYRIFGGHLAMLSTKGFTGHTLGAAGGIEAVFTAAALAEGWVPASLGFREKDPEIPLTPVTQKTPICGHYALSTSLAFGGENAALVIRSIQYTPLG